MDPFCVNLHPAPPAHPRLNGVLPPVDFGDSIEIFSPTPAVAAAASAADRTNDLSYVLRLTYAGWQIIFGGDAESAAWDSMVQQYGVDPKLGFVHFVDRTREAGYRGLTPPCQERVSHGSPAFGDCTRRPGL